VSCFTDSRTKRDKTEEKGGKMQTQNQWHSLPARETLGGLSAALSEARHGLEIGYGR